MKHYSKWLMRISAVYALIGAFLGSDMAGREDYTLIPVHTHILLVGWLTLFAYSIFYYVVKEVSMKKIAKLHLWASIIGGGLMPLGMFLYKNTENIATLLSFIIPASILLIAMVSFIIILFFDKKVFARD